MSDTPRTDKLLERKQSMSADRASLIDHACQLERELFMVEETLKHTNASMRILEAEIARLRKLIPLSPADQRLRELNNQYNNMSR